MFSYGKAYYTGHFVVILHWYALELQKSSKPNTRYIHYVVYTEVMVAIIFTFRITPRKINSLILNIIYAACKHSKLRNLMAEMSLSLNERLKTITCNVSKPIEQISS